MEGRPTNDSGLEPDEDILSLGNLGDEFPLGGRIHLALIGDLVGVVENLGCGVGLFEELHSKIGSKQELGRIAEGEGLRVGDGLELVGVLRSSLVEESHNSLGKAEKNEGADALHYSRRAKT